MRLSLKLTLVYYICVVVIILWSTYQVAEAVVLNANRMSMTKKSFIYGADAESFAIFPSDFSRWMNLQSVDGKQFSDLMTSLGRPVLRLASMQRWDWRGENETLLLVKSNNHQNNKKTIGYPYFTATQYYDFCKAYQIETIPMLDVRLFYDSITGTTKLTSDNVSVASQQYASGYAEFIKKGNYKIAFWEIGNEDYSKDHNMAPSSYAKITRAFIDAIVKIEPSARFCIHLNIWRPDWRSWSETVLDKLKGYEDYISYAAVHYYSESAFSDKIADETINFLRSKGFLRTRLAITEWRHTYLPDEYDQTFQSASRYSRYLMFLLRHPEIEVSCVHAFPLFGGLAEWSNGNFWTSYSNSEPSKRRRDTVGRPRWRVLPFGHAQRMLIDATRGYSLRDYNENPGFLSEYLFSKQSGGYSLVIINENSQTQDVEIVIKSENRVKHLSGKELYCPDPYALPQDGVYQPWSVIPVSSGGRSDGSTVSTFALSDGIIKANIRPFSVISLDLQ